MPYVKTKAPEFLRLREAAKLTGVTTTTIRSWANEGMLDHYFTPHGQRMFNKESILTLTRGNRPPEKKRETFIYCRVSSKKQENDLERQVNLLRDAYPGYTLVTDVASGINWKRKGLQTILEQAMSGSVETVVVANRDRLARFAFELIEWIITSKGGKLIIHDQQNGQCPEPTSEQELAEDLLSIVHVYSCRQMGRRRYGQSSKKSDQDPPPPNNGTENAS
jgi:putative resolvase